MIVKTVVVGSESALKIRAVKSAFAKMLLDPEILPCAVSSGVPNQPFGKNIIRNIYHIRQYRADLYPFNL